MGLKSILLSLALAAAAVAPAASQSYPSKPIKMIVPYAPGGTSDIIARLLAEKAAATLKTSIVVENAGGAGGVIGVNRAAKSTGDGYTIVLLSNPQTTMAVPLQPNLPYDPKTDLKPITHLLNTPTTLWGGPTVPSRNLKDFIAFVRSKPPETVKYGSAGVGSLQHLTMVMLERETGLKLLHIPYAGSGPAMVDQVAGVIDLQWLSLTGAKSQYDAGKIYPIVHEGTERSAALPNVPTVVEEGFPSLAVPVWYGMMAPKGTTDEQIEILNKAFSQAIKDLEAKWNEFGAVMVAGGPKDFAKLLDEDYARWTDIVKATGISVSN